MNNKKTQTVRQESAEQFISALKEKGCQILSVKVDPNNFMYLVVGYTSA